MGLGKTLTALATIAASRASAVAFAASGRTHSVTFSRASLVLVPSERTPYQMFPQVRIFGNGRSSAVGYLVPGNNTVRHHRRPDCCRADVLKTFLPRNPSLPQVSWRRAVSIRQKTLRLRRRTHNLRHGHVRVQEAGEHIAQVALVPSCAGRRYGLDLLTKANADRLSSHYSIFW